MFIQKYKLNNSYTTYVVMDDGKEEFKTVRLKSLVTDWSVGNKVIHPFHGEGTISMLGSNELAVVFRSSKLFKNVKDVIISYTFNNSPKEIDNLKLCI